MRQINQHPAIAAARAQLATRDDGHLPRPTRLEIFHALGPNDPGDPKSYLRTVARAQAVGSVLPHWTAARPDDQRPQLLLSAALSTWDTLSAADSEADAFWPEVVEALSYEVPEQAAHAGMAAAVLVWNALSPDDQPDLDDHDLDPEMWDSEFSASLAAIGVDDLEPQTCARRREFWTWWLDEAVPAAAEAGLRPE